MNDQLQKQLADMLASLTNAAKDGAVWVGNQIPPLVQEKIALGRAEESIVMLFCLSLFLLVGYASYRAWKQVIKCANNEDGIAAMFFGQCLLLAIGLLPIYLELHGFLMVWFAPRLYIVEWLKSMVTK